MKKLIHIEAKTENNQSLLHFEIPNYSEIKKIEYVYHTSRYRALVLIDETFAIRSLKDKTKTETYQVIGLNQEINELTGTNLIIVSRNNNNQAGYHVNVDYGDVYLLKKIVEPRDDLDRAQDILEFNLDQELKEGTLEEIPF